VKKELEIERDHKKLVLEFLMDNRDSNDNVNLD
jgi:hypothetical protein